MKNLANLRRGYALTKKFRNLGFSGAPMLFSQLNPDPCRKPTYPSLKCTFASREHPPWSQLFRADYSACSCSHCCSCWLRWNRLLACAKSCYIGVCLYLVGSARCCPSCLPTARINRLITFTFPSVSFCLQRLCLQSVFLQKRL